MYLHYGYRLRDYDYPTYHSIHDEPITRGIDECLKLQSQGKFLTQPEKAMVRKYAESQRTNKAKKVRK